MGRSQLANPVDLEEHRHPRVRRAITPRLSCPGNPCGANPDSWSSVSRAGVAQFTAMLALYKFIAGHDGGSRICVAPRGTAIVHHGTRSADGPTSICSVPMDGSAPRLLAPVGSNRNE